MLQPRIDRDPPNSVFAPLAQLPAIYPALPDIELETPPLPRDHPQWMRDSLAVSARCRGLFARIKPIVVRVLTFWDHQVRSILIAGRQVSVDPSGCYKID